MDKRLSQRVWLCTKEEGWNGTQVSKEPNYEIKKIWAVCGAQAAFGAVHNAEITVLEEFLKPRPDKESRPSTYVSKWNKDNRPEFKTAMLLVQHVHDRVSPLDLLPSTPLVPLQPRH